VIRVCAWCNGEMGFKPGPSHEITHGICPDCLTRLRGPSAHVLIGELLERLGVPVFLLGDDAHVLAVNTMAAAVLGKEAQGLGGLSTGHAVECARASVGRGCGTTPACRGCSLLGTVEDTYQTGRTHYRVPVTITRTEDGRRQIKLHVSTEKLSHGVLLRIDAVDDQPTATTPRRIEPT
jgi:hypothetical protein